MEELAVEAVAVPSELRDDFLEVLGRFEVLVLAKDFDQVDALILELLQRLEVAHGSLFYRGAPANYTSS